ncbi:MAG TPA: 5-oxoprolinase subunit PxpA [Opitutaceae bacterium]
MTGPSIDLNADVGEGSGHDEELIPLVSSVNIACGAHAGDRQTMRDAVLLAKAHGVAIGAHPGFADRENFGRVEIAINPAAAGALVVGQLRLLRAVAVQCGASVGHVKLHGALYNMAARDRVLAQGICAALLADSGGNAGLLVYALAGSAFIETARALGMSVIGEAFADRGYRADGSLVPRSEAGAVKASADEAAAQALGIARDRTVAAANGDRLRLDADTICIHGDGPCAVRLAGLVRTGLEASGIRIGPVSLPIKPAIT